VKSLKDTTEPVPGSELGDAKSKLAGLIEAAGLKGTFDDETLSALAVMQERIQGRIGELAALLAQKKLSRQEYIEELDRALAAASRSGENLMGIENFHRVFGELRPDQLGDVAAFLEHGYDPSH
jgi:hypothetical protein